MVKITYRFSLHFIYLASLILFISACSKNELALDGQTSIEEEKKNSYVTLTDLQIGQSSTYLRYVNTCMNGVSDFLYTGDTLILSILEEEGQLYFEERITDHSPLANSEVIKHKVYGDGQRVLIPERVDSYLFFFFGNDTIPVMEKHTTNLNQQGCFLFEDENLFIGNDIGQIDEFSIGDIFLIDKRAISCVPLILDIDAYLIYDNEQLFQSYISAQQDVSTIGSIGWTLLNSK